MSTELPLISSPKRGRVTDISNVVNNRAKNMTQKRKCNIMIMYI